MSVNIPPHTSYNNNKIKNFKLKLLEQTTKRGDNKNNKSKLGEVKYQNT